MSFLERVDESIRRSAGRGASIFRNPYPNDERSRAYAVMNNVFLHLHPVRVRQHAVKFAYTFCLGGLVVLPVPGPDRDRRLPDVLLRPVGDPGVHEHPRHPEPRSSFGLLTRNIHRWAAHLMVFFVFLHMMRVFYHGAYKPPREFNWVVGRRAPVPHDHAVSFTGYLLPWDQIAYWAITIGTNMAGYAPLLQHAQSKLLLLGGMEVGQNTLLRFYVLHIMVFPLVAAIFLAVHFWRIRKDGGISRAAVSDRGARQPHAPGAVIGRRRRPAPSRRCRRTAVPAAARRTARRRRSTSSACRCRPSRTACWRWSSRTPSCGSRRSPTTRS